VNSLFGLEISVDNLVSMAVLDGADDLLEQAASLCLWHLAPIHNVLKEFSWSILRRRGDVEEEKGQYCEMGLSFQWIRSAHLDDHDDVHRCGDDLVQLDDVGMP
jgi:hypothetical protein